MPLLLGVPYVPVIPERFEPWKSIRHTWTGWDGSVWELSNPRSGVFLLAEGLEGMGLPEIRNYTHGSPVVHGVEWDGWLATGRKVRWNIGVYSDEGSKGWIDVNRAFWRTLRPGTTGVWTVELLATGEKFSLTLRIADGNNQVFNRDPVRRGWQAYGVETFPENPFWDAGTIVGSWVVGKQIPFYGFQGFGPPFYHSPASQVASATITNPGDVEAFIEWTVVGPATTAAVGLNGQMTIVPFEVPSGARLVIDTNPLNMIAELDGEDVMDQIGFGNWNPTPLPPGEDVQLTLEMTGTGSIEARFKHHVLMSL